MGQLRYSSPHEIVQAALSALRPDGTVEYTDPELETSYVIEPYEPINVAVLSDGAYTDELLRLARVIYRVVADTVRDPDGIDESINDLAHLLTAYEHAPDFIEQACALVTIDEQGFLHHPVIPLGRQARRCYSTSLAR